MMFSFLSKFLHFDFRYYGRYHYTFILNEFYKRLSPWQHLLVIVLSEFSHMLGMFLLGDGASSYSSTYYIWQRVNSIL